MKHFLKENDWDNEQIEDVFNLAFDFKHNRNQRPTDHLRGQTWGMLFFKNSTRTRVSFEVGINELGGRSLILDQSSTQIGRGESIADTTRVLSRYLDGLVIRAHGHEYLRTYSRTSALPIGEQDQDLHVPTSQSNGSHAPEWYFSSRHQAREHSHLRRRAEGG